MACVAAQVEKPLKSDVNNSASATSQVRKVDPVPAQGWEAFKLEAGTGSTFPTCKFAELVLLIAGS